MPLQNWEVFAKDPRAATIPNDGVTEVGMPTTAREWEVLRYELSTFVCDGEYENGIERILSTYLSNLDKATQPAAWVSGFYGSGKSHLVRVLEYLWRDVGFPDGVSARSLVDLPSDIEAALTELSNAGKRAGGLWAAAGTLGAEAGDSFRLAVLGILFKSAGLPENYVQGRFALWLRKKKVYEKVRDHIEAEDESFVGEVNDLYVSPLIADAVMAAIPGFADTRLQAREFIKAQFANVSDIENEEMLELMTDVMALQSGDRDNLPCTLLVLDELQQYIGDDSDRTLKVQILVQACTRRFGSRLLVVATGQSALQAHPQLQKLKDRFTVPVELTDTDVEKVLRQVVLRKAPSHEPDVLDVLTKNSGEIDRHLQGTKVAAKAADKPVLTADYPLLPSRRRFWERVLRAIDRAGSAGQLRTQLRTVHEATKSVADDLLGTVVPGDYIYAQQSASMLQSGVLLKEIHEIINELDDGSAEGRLRSRACALIFLIQQLPRDGAADVGVRSTVTMLADLMVGNLEEDGPKLRQQVPALLEGLVEQGALLKVQGEAGDEYRLQTRESSEWEQAYRSAFSAAQADAGRIASERGKELRQAVSETLRNVPITQGESKTPRRVEVSFGAEKPKADGSIPVWVRDEWGVSEKTVREDARTEGTSDAVIYVSLPKRNADNLKKAISGYLAATEVLQSKGAFTPTTPEGMEAQQGMRTRQVSHRRDIDSLLTEIVGNARVFQGGGTEVVESNLRAAVQEAARKAVVRLYSNFDVADDTRWKKVMDRARQGSGDPLSALGYSGEVDKHSACAMVLTFVGGGGKKGSEVRKEFESVPYGWPREAVDGSLFALLATDHLSAQINGSAVDVKALDGTKVSGAAFRAQSVKIGALERIQIRKALVAPGVSVKNGEELAAVPLFLSAMRDLARNAGAKAPAPASPNPDYLETIQHLSGNEQLMAIYHEREQIEGDVEAWQKAAKDIGDRLPRWERLKRALTYAEGLSAADDVQDEVSAVESQRLLIRDPDPVSPLATQVFDALRVEVQEAHEKLKSTYAKEMHDLASHQAWKDLPAAEAEAILHRHGLQEPHAPKLGTEDELLTALDQSSLADISNRIAALPSRTSKALHDAIKSHEPRTIPVQAPVRTLASAEDVDAYLQELRDVIMQYIEDGNPVVVSQG